MRIVIAGFAALLLGAQAACAASLLFATEASTNAVDGFCIRPDGSLAPTPKVHVDTAGVQPRRLLVANGMLYVAELDRIEVFPIGAGGDLKRPRSTKVTSNLDPRDLALSPDGKTLYATQHGYISAYALDADGSIPESSTSCVQGVDSANYLDLQVTSDLLYASADDAPGRIEVYRLNCDGSLPPPNADGTPGPPPGSVCPPPAGMPQAVQTDCGPANRKHTAIAPIWPYSERSKIQKPKAMILAEGMIYVEERALRRLIAFRLQPDGTFCDKKKNRKDKNDIYTENCTGFDELGTKQCTAKQAKKQRQQCTSSQTNEVLQYEGLALHPDGETLLGTQFFQGRVDSYRLRPDERLSGAPRSRLPKSPTVLSEQDARMTPVRLAVDGNTLYVASGQFNRVVAYHLAGNGVLADRNPFSRTDERKNSFPNDVAVSMLSAPCE